MKLITIIAMLIITATLASAYEYIPNVDPHTRYNNMLNDCFYFYGYGSCNVSKVQCDGVGIGQNRWIDLGDACNRNQPPKIIIKANDITAIETEIVKINDAVECQDQDPVKIVYSGWTNQSEKKTGYDDAGIYQETVTCTDSFGKTDSAEITITIQNKNRAPLFRAIGFEVGIKE